MSKGHVHILVSAPPNMAPSEIMRRIKGCSSVKLFENFPVLKRDIGGVISGLGDISVSHQDMLPKK